MSTWHVWGDFVHTRPEQIGSARLLQGDHEQARETANASGFDFERRTHNGFEPWAAIFVSDVDEGQEFAFASYATVRGWRRV